MWRQHQLFAQQHRRMEEYVYCMQSLSHKWRKHMQPLSTNHFHRILEVVSNIYNLERWV